MRSYPATKPFKLVLLLTAVVLTGCAAMGSRVETPRIALAGMRVQEIRGFETVFEVDLRVFNRSDRSLFISGLDCDLALNGRHLAQGVADPQKELAPYKDEIITVTVYASMVDMVVAGRNILKGDGAAGHLSKWDYTLKGHVRLREQDRYLGNHAFESKGEIDLAPLRSVQEK